MDISKLLEYLETETFEYSYYDEFGGEHKMRLTYEDSEVYKYNHDGNYKCYIIPEDTEKLGEEIENDFKKGKDFAFSEDGIIGLGGEM